MTRVAIYPAAPPLDGRIRNRFAMLPTPLLSDSLERMAAAVGLHPVGNCLSTLKGRTMVGPALTVRTRPGDNLAVHKALDLGRPGDVLVIDARGHLTNAIIGELMVTYAAARGFAGVVVDGAIRDSRALSRGPIPVFARGVSPLGPYKSGPGEIGTAITVGGVAVRNGDVVAGDDDGIVIVPRDRIEEALRSAEEIAKKEHSLLQSLPSGQWPRAYLDEIELVSFDEV